MKLNLAVLAASAVTLVAAQDYADDYNTDALAEMDEDDLLEDFDGDMFDSDDDVLDEDAAAAMRADGVFEDALDDPSDAPSTRLPPAPRMKAVSSATRCRVCAMRAKRRVRCAMSLKP